MAGRVVGRIFERKVGSPSKKAVFLCLGEHANPDGEMSFPSVDRIAQETELGESTVREALAWLRKEELIIQTHAPAHHRPATYRVNLERLSDLQLVEVYRKSDLQGAGSGVQLAGPDLQEVAGDLQELESRPPAAGPEPSFNRPLNPQEPSGTAAAKDLWARALGVMQAEMPRATFDTWLRDTVGVALTDGELAVACANAYGRDWLENRMKNTCENTLIGIEGKSVSVQFVIFREAE